MRASVAIVVAMLGLGLARPSAAMTFTVNPTCSLNGDGRAATCAASPGAIGAWNDLGATGCGGTKLLAGDTLDLKAGTTPYRRWNFPNCSGANGSPIVIQNAAGEAVVFDGTDDIHTSTWTAIGGGVFLCSAGLCGTNGNFPFAAKYQRGTNGEELLTMIHATRTCDATVPADSMVYTSSNQVCAHLSDGSSPAATTYFRIPTDFMGINLNSTTSNGGDYLTFRKNPAGGSFTIQWMKVYGIALTNNRVGITYDGLDVGWVMDRCLDDTSLGSSVVANHVVANCTVHHCGQEGIRIDRDLGTNGLIRNNVVHDIQVPPLFPRCLGVGAGCLSGFTDHGTGIRVAAVTNTTVTGNTVFHVGGGGDGKSYAIDLENGCDATTIASNLLYDVNGNVAGGRFGYGILLSTSVDDYRNCNIWNNRIWDTEVGIAVEPAATIASGPVRIFHNTILDSVMTGLGYESDTGTWTGAITVIDNLIANLHATPTNGLINIGAGQAPGMTTPTYGAYECSACTTDQAIVSFHGSTYKRNGECSGNCIPNLDAQSAYGTTNIVSTATPPSMNLLSCSGVACDRGLTTMVTNDYLGTTRPQGATVDIGAHEFIPTGPTPTASGPIRTAEPLATTAASASPDGRVQAERGKRQEGAIGH